jgi:hypothetical protein
MKRPERRKAISNIGIVIVIVGIIILALVAGSVVLFPYLGITPTPTGLTSNTLESTSSSSEVSTVPQFPPSTSTSISIVTKTSTSSSTTTTSVYSNTATATSISTTTTATSNQAETTTSSNTTNLEKDMTNMAGYVVQTTDASGTLKVQSTWKVPTLTCTLSQSFIDFYVGVTHQYTEFSGSQLYAYCDGTSAVYDMQYALVYGGVANLTSSDTVLPGDMMLTIASIVVSTNVASIEIKDLTKGWTFGPMTATQYVSPGGDGDVQIYMCGESFECTYSTPIPIPKFTTISTSGDVLTLGAHEGTLGSFLGVSGDGVFEFIMENPSTGHALAEPSSITSTSSSFGIQFVQSS